MRTSRIAVASLIVVVLVAGLMIVSAGTALADAGGHASCMGFEASGVSPAGTSDEIPGGMHQFTQVIRELSVGAPPGRIYSAIAKLHEGSHETCDEALE